MSRVAFVTGASRGIGSAIAVMLAQAGHSVAIGYRVSADKANAVVEMIRSAGGQAKSIQVEVSDRMSIREAFKKIATQLGQVDILVNNAAIAQEKPFDEITDEDWDAMFAVNLKGPFICSQEGLPWMIKRGWGRIINIVSIGGQWGGVNQIHYASAKSGLIGLTRSLAKVYSGFGITINAVSPGLVETDMSARELESTAGKDKVNNIPIGRIAKAEEIGATVVFLASDGASYITGQTLNVNGGMLFR